MTDSADDTTTPKNPSFEAPDPSRIAAVLDPWVVTRTAADSPEWRRRMRRKAGRWRRRALTKRLFSWASAIMPAAKDRTLDAVRGEYEEIWEAANIDRAAERKPLPAEWRGEGLLVKRGALNRVHLLLMADVIERLAPRRVLEVGSGDGRNLFSFACRFPETPFFGVELTEAGVARARRLREAETLPDELARYMPWDSVDASAYRTIDVRVGSATALPFDDDSFDLVYTHLALEQMESVREQALSEIARVSSGHVLFVEPFADFNRSGMQRSYVAARGYLSLPLSQLPRFGLEPIHVTDAFPQKVRLGQGLVVARVRRTATASPDADSAETGV